MDVVSDTRAVRRVVVAAENTQALTPADCDLLHERHEVVGHATRGLADPARRVRAGGVEVAQDGDLQARVGLAGVLENLLDHVLGPAVGVGAAERLFFINGLLVRLVDCRRRGEHDVVAARLLHGLQDVQGAHDVVLVVPERLGHGLAHGLEAGEVDHAVELLRLEELLHGLCVAHVRLEERNILAGDLLNAIYGLGRGIHQVVHDGHLEACLQKLDDGVRADVAGAAGAANVLRHSSNYDTSVPLGS
mmetsp:Transcript_101059/g.257056  ORF Transcript_101059/g.257056 Transcript_101059/m.257056 type:complete len:248 (-) Transcript_101059:33-776(-)